MKISTIVSAVAAIIAASVCVSAATAAPAPSEVRVGVADLDLSVAADRMVFDHRVAAAAHQACGDEARDFDRSARINTGLCFRTAIERANADAGLMRPTAIALR